MQKTVYLQFSDIKELQTTDGSLGLVSRGELGIEVRSRIIGCRPQIMSFKFFYRINLSFTIYSITGNLSKVLQAEVISAVESQKTTKFSLETLEIMRSQENSDAFFDTVKLKVEKFDFVEEPSIPR